jgi:dihydrofolate reductase
MRITLVVAVSDNGVIGRNGGLPWRLPEDLRRFRELTLGKPVLMGRRTYESIGRPLPGRRNVVISGRPGLEIDGCEVAASPEEALALIDEAGEAMVIGGEAIYRHFLPQAQRIHRTRVHATVEGDAFFPELDGKDWRLVASEGRRSADPPLRFTFETLVRR